MSQKSIAAPAGADVIYTCPMHPQIRQRGPGHCPICGMTLEPEMPAAEPERDTELADMTRRFWIALVLSTPVVALEMGGHLMRLPLSEAVSNGIQFVLATPVVLWAGWPFLVRAWQSILNRSLNMFTLIAMGTGAAWIYSALGVLTPQIFPPAFRMGGTVAVYFEAAAVITVLVLLGQVLELRARAQTSGAIRALLDLAPKTARRLKPDGDEEDVPLDHVAAGDRLRVRPGEKVPVDGLLLEGRSALDESMVTGESMPVTKEAGARLIAGTLNQSGGLVMRAEKIGRDTLLARIVQMVAAAQRSRAPIQRLADQVAGWFVPAVIAVALAAFVIWALVGPEPRFAYGFVASVTVLIIACPCALGLATPMAIMVGVGRGAGAGVLIKNAEALERMEKIDTLVIDKTGTLTEGKPKLVAIVSPELEEDDILRLAASIERASEHPLARAIVAAATDRKLALSDVTGFDSSRRQGRARPSRRQARRRRQCRISPFAGDRDEGPQRPRGPAAPGRRHRPLCRHRCHGRGLAGDCRSRQAVDFPGLESPDGCGHPRGHADRRQPHHGRGGGETSGNFRRRSGGASRGQERHRGETAPRRPGRGHGGRRRQ